MNYKLEKFWNLNGVLNVFIDSIMNYKLEKFWNANSLIFIHLNWRYEL